YPFSFESGRGSREARLSDLWQAPHEDRRDLTAVDLDQLVGRFKMSVCGQSQPATSMPMRWFGHATVAGPLRAAWSAPKQTDLVPGKGQFHSGAPKRLLLIATEISPAWS